MVTGTVQAKTASALGPATKPDLTINACGRESKLSFSMFLSLLLNSRLIQARVGRGSIANPEA